MGAHGGPWGAYGGFFVDRWCYHKAHRKPHGLQEALMPAPWQPIFFGGGTGGPEVKFGQIAPYFGDQKLHVPGCFLHGFGSILMGLSSDYNQIMKIMENAVKIGPEPF